MLWEAQSRVFLAFEKWKSGKGLGQRDFEEQARVHIQNHRETRQTHFRKGVNKGVEAGKHGVVCTGENTQALELMLEVTWDITQSDPHVEKVK